MNITLAKQAYRYIKSNPSEWDQGTYMSCYAAHVCMQDGRTVLADGHVRAVADYADRALDIADRYHTLYLARNTLSDIRRTLNTYIREEYPLTFLFRRIR